MQCPKWIDADEHASPACFELVQEVVRRACVRARNGIPSAQDVLSWHEDAFSASVPLDYYAGNFRQSDPVRVCLAQNVAVAGVPGLPFEAVTDAVARLFEFLRQQLSVIELNWASLSPEDRLKRFATVVGTAVGAFIRIHPFVNGNGRTSRIIWTALFYRIGLPPQITVVRRPAGSYGDVMRRAMHGDYAPAILLVLSAIQNAPVAARQKELPLPVSQEAR